MPVVSGEGHVFVRGEFVEITPRNMWDTSSTLTIDAELYNTQKTTKYRLPRDIWLTYNSTLPSDFSIQKVWLPRDANYKLQLYGYGELAPRDVRWYMHTDPSIPCSARDGWDSRRWSKVTPQEIETKDAWQIYNRTYHLDIPVQSPHLCVIAGIGGDFVVAEYRNITEFSVTGALTSVLSPEYDMKSEIEFRFSHSLYSDTGELYSPAYIENRKKQKIEFLKRLDIVPFVPITEDQISLTPDRATILGNFQEWVEYTLSLRDVSDIYGRSSSTEMRFTPQAEPFLSLGLAKRRTMFRVDERVDAKLYSLKTPKDTYTLKLCNITLESYARVERMIWEWKKEYTDALYSLLDSSNQVSQCIKKDIVIASWSTMTPFSLQDLLPSGRSLTPWLYILALRNKDDTTPFSRFVAPRVFSIIDSQITMKVDASGKMNFLVTDIVTGEPRSSQSLSLLQNISQTYSQRWDQSQQKYVTEYLPITNRVFSTGIVLWSTNPDGSLSTKKEKIYEESYMTPYSLMDEYSWDYEGRYSSFIATASGSGHFGYVVSTWNDGITWWNFWLKDGDYSWYELPEFSSYLHTDRKLYLPWEVAHIHAIVRANDNWLQIPKDAKFSVLVTDPLGAEVATTDVIPNEFGTISVDFQIPKESPLWLYNITLRDAKNENAYVRNGMTNFQVEVFKNPTFTANVSLRSPDVEENILTNLREKPNTDPNNPWYEHVYTSTFSLEWIVKAQYYNGSQFRGVPFSYRIYRSPAYGDGYWGDCFWGCYYDAPLEFYTEWTGSIDNDGLWVFRLPIEFSSFITDYTYTAEVTLRDPLSGEEVVTPATLQVWIPKKYKAFDPYNPLVFTPERKILQPGEKLSWTFAPQYGKWDVSWGDRYTYEIIAKKYESMRIDDLRNPDLTQIIEREYIVASWSIKDKDFAFDIKDLSPGEYHLITRPLTPTGQDAPSESISDTLFYIAGDFQNKDSYLRVIPEKTVYHLWETARVMITTPFTGGYLYLTRERGWVIDHEYIKLTGNTLTKEYVVDESFAPNLYIWAIAFPPSYTYGSRGYAVGYGEIVVDISDTVGKIQITPNKEKYENRETVDLDLTFSDKSGNPLEWEIAVMVVDESLIRLLGNIDLDIIPKFFEKHPFTTKTSLTAIGMERNRFLSRKWANGGSGDKWGGGIQVASRILFKNTAYYNPSVRTDVRGKAKVSFSLPDNITDYRIITIGQTRSSRFAVAEKTIPVRKKYTLESHVPLIVYPWDSTTFSVSAFNSTEKITGATVYFALGSGSNIQKSEAPLILPVGWSAWTGFVVKIPDTYSGEVPYTFSLIEKWIVLDSVTRTFHVPPIPLLETTTRELAIMSGSEMNITLPKIPPNTDPLRSQVEIHVSQSLLTRPQDIIESLIAYPYGCIEQTIASTLPNALALKYSSIFGTKIDTKKAQENLSAWVSKILRMQYFGGWKYWESDSSVQPRVTPYVIRSLLLLRELGVEIPQASIDAGRDYLVNMVDYQSELFSSERDLQAEVYATLAALKSPKADILRESINSEQANPTLSWKTLSRHGYLMYAYGLQAQWLLTEDKQKYLDFLMRSAESSDYWYWNTQADQALYARLLINLGRTDEATKILDALVRENNLTSYYVSTQEKIQILTALIELSEKTPKTPKIDIALRGGTIIADLSINPENPTNHISVSRDKIWDTIKLTRKWERWTFVEIVQKEVPKDISLVSPYATGGIGIERIFEKIDESKGMTSDGQFLSKSPVTDGVFYKWQLYQVTLKVTPPKSSHPQYYLTAEDFVPGGWRPIRWVFSTESKLLASTDASSSYWYGWSHVESRDDRILATSDVLWNSGVQTYTYYIRPEFVWRYLLPPATAYFMYRPEISARTMYQGVEVR